jgi:hypothetical protein
MGNTGFVQKRIRETLPGIPVPPAPCAVLNIISVYEDS